MMKFYKKFNKFWQERHCASKFSQERHCASKQWWMNWLEERQLGDCVSTTAIKRPKGKKYERSWRGKRREKKQNKLLRRRSGRLRPPIGSSRRGAASASSNSELELCIGWGSRGSEQRSVCHPVSRVVAYDGHPERIDTRCICILNCGWAKNTTIMPWRHGSSSWLPLGTRFSRVDHVFREYFIIFKENI